MTATTAMKERPILFSGEMIRAILAARKTQTRRILKFSDNVDVPVVHRVHRGQYGSSWGKGRYGIKDGFVPLNRYGGIATKPFHAHHIVCPYGVPGDRLWVRETWQSFRELTNAERVEQESILGRFFAGQIPADEIADAAMSLPNGSGNQRVLYAADFGEWAYSPDSDLRPWRPSIFMPRWASRITLEVVSVRAERLQDISEEDAQAEGCSDHEGNGPFLSPFGGRRIVNNFAALWNSINGKRAPWASNPWVWRVEFRRIEANL